MTVYPVPVNRPEFAPELCRELLGEPDEVGAWFRLPDDCLLAVVTITEEAFSWVH